MSIGRPPTNPALIGQVEAMFRSGATAAVCATSSGLSLATVNRIKRRARDEGRLAGPVPGPGAAPHVASGRPASAAPLPAPPSALGFLAQVRDPKKLGALLVTLTEEATAVWLGVVKRQIDANDPRCLPTLMALGPSTARLAGPVLEVAKAAMDEEAAPAADSDASTYDLDRFKIGSAA